MTGCRERVRNGSPALFPLRDAHSPLPLSPSFAPNRLVGEEFCYLYAALLYVAAMGRDAALLIDVACKLTASIRHHASSSPLKSAWASPLLSALFPDGRFDKVTVVSEFDDVSGNNVVAVEFFKNGASVTRARITLAIDGMHAFGHACALLYGAPWVSGYGVLSAFVERYFSSITPRAGSMHNLSLSNFIDMMEVVLKTHNRANRSATDVARDHILLLTRAAVARNEYVSLCAAAKLTDVDVIATLAELRRTPTSAKLRPNSDLKALIKRLAALFSHLWAARQGLPRLHRHAAGGAGGVVELHLQSAINSAPALPRQIGFKLLPTFASFDNALTIVKRKLDSAMRLHSHTVPPELSTVVAQLVTRLRFLVRTYKLLDARVKGGLREFTGKRSSTLVHINGVLSDLRPVVANTSYTAAVPTLQAWSATFPASAKEVVQAEDINCVIPAGIAPETDHSASLVVVRAYAKWRGYDEDVTRFSAVYPKLVDAYTRVATELGGAARAAADFSKPGLEFSAVERAACLRFMEASGLTRAHWGVPVGDAMVRGRTLAGGCVLALRARGLLAEFATRANVAAVRALNNAAVAKRVADAMALIDIHAVPIIVPHGGPYALRRDRLSRLGRGQFPAASFAHFFGPPASQPALFAAASAITKAPVTAVVTAAAAAASIAAADDGVDDTLADDDDDFQSTEDSPGFLDWEDEPLDEDDEDGDGGELDVSFLDDAAGSTSVAADGPDEELVLS